MKKKDLIQFCRYYKGEKENPFIGNKALFWDYEKIWIDYNFSEHGRTLLSDYIDDYTRVGLSLFEMKDNTPASLKALLFFRFCYWKSASIIECVEPFKDFYNKEYIG